MGWAGLERLSARGQGKQLIRSLPLWAPGLAQNHQERAGCGGCEERGRAGRAGERRGVRWEWKGSIQGWGRGRGRATRPWAKKAGTTLSCLPHAAQCQAHGRCLIST